MLIRHEEKYHVSNNNKKLTIINWKFPKKFYCYNKPFLIIRENDVYKGKNEWIDEDLK